MKPWQTAVRYGAIALAVILIVNIAVWGLKTFGFIFGLTSSGTYDEAKVYEFEPEHIENLEISVAAAKLTMRADPCDKIIVKSNIKNLTVKENGDTLKVKEKQGLLTVTHSDAFVEIFYPIGFSVDKAEIYGGAGKLLIGTLIAEEFDLELGAGDTSIDQLTVTKEAEIVGGAGNLSFTRTEITALDLETGVGRLNFNGILNGNNQISLGIGEAFLDFYDDSERYYFDVEKGIGEIEYHGTDDGNFKRENQETSVTIEGGIGKIAVTFFDKVNNQ